MDVIRKSSSSMRRKDLSISTIVGRKATLGKTGVVGAIPHFGFTVAIWRKSLRKTAYKAKITFVCCCCNGDGLMMTSPLLCFETVAALWRTSEGMGARVLLNHTTAMHS